MRRVAPMIAGFGLGFAIVGSIVSAALLVTIGVGGHLLARTDAGVAQVISFDPSTVAARAPFPAAMAIILIVLFWVISFKLGRDERKASRELPDH